MAGYTRNDTSNNIATGNVINAADLDGEFDALVAAFHASTGHTHDGTAANGAPITKIGPAQDLVISTGAITPKTDNTVDLGSSSFEFKDLYIDGTANIDALVADTADINAGTIDGTAIGANSASTGAFTTLSASSTVTLSGGTANGVLYLNGSKVATSGSALTFDGTVLAVNGGTNGSRFSVRGTGAFGGFDTGSANDGRIEYAYNGTNIFYTGIDSASLMTLMARSGVSLAFGANGSEQMRLTSTGLGIGTSSPAYKLHVQNSAANTDTFVGQSSTVGLFTQWRYNATAASAYGEISTYGGNNSVYIQAQSGGGNTILNLQSGNLGIGTSSPAYKLDVNGLIRSAGDAANFLLLEKSANTGVYARWKRPNREYYLALDINNNGGNDFSLYDATAGATRWTVDSSGNLGLGVTPSAWSGFRAMQIGGTTSLWSTTSGNGSSFYTNNGYFNGSSRIYLTSGYATEYIQGQGQHIWYTAPSGTAGDAITFTQAMTLDASGNLGVGTTSPQATIVAAGSNATVYKAMILRNGSGTDGSSATIDFETSTGTQGSEAAMAGRIAGLRISSGTSGALTFSTTNSGVLGERARITSGGDLLVGTTNAAENAGSGMKVLNTGGTVALVSTASDASQQGFEMYSTTAAAYRLYINYAGTINATSTTISAISDQRLKENIQDLDVGLDKIMALKPRKFDWKTGKGKDIKGDRGWIAQEFEQVFPDLIDEWRDPAPEGEEPYKSVRADLIPILVKAIQEQQAIITSLTARVALLEGN